MSEHGIDFARAAIERRLGLGFTPAEARSFIQDLENVARADAYRDVRWAIEDELKGAPADPDDHFDAGSRAAYHYVLSKLGTAIADDPPDASRPLFPAPVSPAETSIDVDRLRQAWLNHRASYFRGPGTLLWHTCWDGCSEDLAREYADPRSRP